METKNLNVKINSDALNDCANEIETIGKRIEEIFKRVDELMTSVYDTDAWKGDTNKAYHNRYLELKKYFPKVNNGIKSYANFLKLTSENYETGESIINNSIEDNTYSLDVNS